MSQARDYDVEEAEWRTARLKHTCQICKKAIFPGEKYYYERTPWFVSGKTHKTCEACYKANKRKEKKS